MSSAQTSYQCRNCGTRFQLAADANLRCPSCFWTTSIEVVGAVSVERERVKAPEKSVQMRTKTSKPPRIIGQITALVFLMIFALAFGYYMIKLNPGLFGEIRIRGDRSVELGAGEDVLLEKEAEKDTSRSLSAEEQEILTRRIPFAIPRSLNDDEKQMIESRAEFSLSADQPPQFPFMSLDNFVDLIEAEQIKRKIYFSGKYERSLKKLFKAHYLIAEQAMRERNHLLARDALLQSLVFPIYHNDIRLHRSVAQVMLRGFINDVLGKIQLLNSYLLTLQLAGGINGLTGRYEALLANLRDQNWEDSLSVLEILERDAKALEGKAQGLQIDYPPIVGQIDQDIRKGLEMQDRTLAPVFTGINSLLADLRIKKQVLNQNTSEALEKVKDSHGRAMQAIEENRYDDAELLLQTITFPPEVATDAQQKLAVIEAMESR